MKLIVKDVDIATGDLLVVIINEEDARRLDLHSEDRVKVSLRGRETIAIVDIAESKKAVPPGRIGFFEEMLDNLHAKNGDTVELNLEQKPNSLKSIKRKLDGKELSHEEIFEVVTDLVENKLTDVELTYFIAASYTHGLSFKETISLTKAMIETGDVLKINRYPILDKHSIGGVPGNRTTMIAVPIIVAAGLTMPKTSSRSITSPAGTADTMEVLCDVSLPLSKIKKVVESVGGCIVWGGAVNLAPADDKIIHVENPLSIDAEGQLLSSIMAKKGSVSSTHVLIDIPIGKSTKVESEKEARHLASEFSKVGKEIGMKIKTVITDGKEPIGHGIGPNLEARDVLWLLEQDKRAPQDLWKKSLFLCEEMLTMAGKSKKLAQKMLESGKAHEKMLEIIKAQGSKITDPEKIKMGKYTFDYKAFRTGKIKHLDNLVIAKAARIAGAPKDKAAGIYLYKHTFERVEKGETILTLYAENEEKLEFAKTILKSPQGIILQ